jgi:hypothetical protein
MSATSGTGNVYPSRAPEFTPGLGGVRVALSLVFVESFVDRCLSFFYFGRWVVCPSIYGFLLPLWHLETLLMVTCIQRNKFIKIISVIAV